MMQFQHHHLGASCKFDDFVFWPNNHFYLVTSVISLLFSFMVIIVVLPHYSIHWIRIGQYIHKCDDFARFSSLFKEDVNIKKCPKTESEKATKLIGRSRWLKLS